jgi:hypothetical protein
VDRTDPALKLDARPAFIWFEYILNWIGVLALGVVVAMAARGDFGKDDRARRVAGERDGALWARYERVARAYTRTDLEIHVRPAAENREAAISISTSYLERMNLVSVLPTPGRVESAEDWTTYVFDAGSAGRPVVARFWLEPNRAGTHDAKLRAGNGESVGFTQRVVP